MAKQMMNRMFKAHENRGFVLSVAAASLALGLIGCGGSVGKDPTAEFSGLVAPHGEQPRDQAVLDRSYVIEPEKDVTFIEGETSSFKVRVRLFFPVESFSLKLVGVPSDIQNISLSKVQGEAGTYQISWTAPKGVIPTDRPDRNVKYRLELGDVKSADASVEALFRSISKVQDFSFNVRRTGKTPKIVAVNSLPSEVAQGSMVPFTVDVEDPASYEGYSPRLDVYFQGTNKTESGYEANGATYVRVESTPKHIGNGVWRFSYVFDARNNDVGAQLDRDGKRVDGATHLQTRLMLKAYSGSGGVSSEKPVFTKIKFEKAQVAVVKPLVCPEPKAEAPKAAAKPAAKAAATKTAPAAKATTKTETKPAAKAADASTDGSTTAAKI